MDKQYSVQFFATFVDNLQELCKSFLDFNQVVEVSGYVCVEIDNVKKERYVLSELVQSGGNVISESYCTKAFRTPGKPMIPPNSGQQRKINPRIASKENINNGKCRPGQPMMRQERRGPPPQAGPQNPRIIRRPGEPPVMQRGRNFGMKGPHGDREESFHPGKMPGQRRVFTEDGEIVQVKAEKPDYFPEEGQMHHGRFYQPESRHKTRVTHEEWKGSDTIVYRNVSIERVTNMPQRGIQTPRITQFADDEEQSGGSESESEEIPMQKMRQQGHWKPNLEPMNDPEQEWSGHPSEQEGEHPQAQNTDEFEIKPDLSLVKQEVEDPEYEASEIKPEDFPMSEEEFYAREKHMSFPPRGINSPKHPAVKPQGGVMSKLSPRPNVHSGPTASQQISMRSPDVGFVRPADVNPPGMDRSLLQIDEEMDEFVEVDMDEFLDDEELAELSQEMMEESQGSSQGDSEDKERKKHRSVQKNQHHALKLFNDYQKKRGEGIKPIQTIHPDRLDTLLSDFFLTVKKSNGQDFGPLYLKKIHSHLDRYLQDAHYPFSIVKDEQFRHSNQILKDKIGELKARSKGGPVAITPISEDDITLMFEAGELGGCNPDTLLNTMWFLNSYFFGIKQPTEHNSLTWGEFSLDKDDDGHEFLQCPSGKFKGGKIFADKEDPERCYVRLYKRYRDKRPPHTNEEEAPFYLTPNRISRGDSIWYSPDPPTPTRLNGIFKKIAAVCGLQDKKMP